MKDYKPLSQEQRYLIETLLRAGKSQAYIARLLGYSRSTISREIRRNTPGSGPARNTYSASYAEYKIKRRRQERYPFRRFDDFMKKMIVYWLKEKSYSPELITEEGRKHYGDFVSHETIYHWIWQMKQSTRIGDQSYSRLYEYLKHKGRRRKRGNYKNNRGIIPNRVSIEQRPALVNNRHRIGDMEVDLVMGKNNRPGLLIITDRSTLLTQLKKISSKNSEHIAKYIIQKLKPFQPWLKTITYDNDLAFAKHEKVNQALNTNSYFTRPYSSQDKGTVENRIWQLRRFFPKGTDFDHVDHHQVLHVQRLLNSRPVRKFNYQTPNAVFLQKSTVALVT
jgi:transposase, IS30 family